MSESGSTTETLRDAFGESIGDETVEAEGESQQRLPTSIEAGGKIRVDTTRFTGAARDLGGKIHGAVDGRARD